MINSLRISVVPKFSKVKSNGEAPLFMRLTMNGERTEVSMQKTVPANSWDKEANRAKGKGAKRINSFIDEEIAFVRSFKREYDLKGVMYSVDDFKRRYQGDNGVEDVFLLKKFKDHIAYMENLEGKTYVKKTITNYKVTLTHLEDYVRSEYGEPDIHVQKVDNAFVRGFDSFLKVTKNHAHNTVVKNMKRLKKIVAECRAEGLISIDPFFRIKLGYKSGNKDALNKYELDKIINKEFRLEKLNRVKDVFVFCCLTGLAYIDVKNLTPKNLVKLDSGVLILKGNRSKTNEPYIIYLLPKARTILEKYSDHPICVQQQVLLPVISNQKMNDMLKEIAAILEIDKKVTTHVARYTFITTVSIANGISSSITATVAGQSNTSMTDAYTKLEEMAVVESMKQLDNIF